MNKERNEDNLVPKAVSIHPTAWIHELLEIEDGATIGPGVIFVPGGNIKTIIRNNVEIGAGSVIGSGIEIGYGACISPGSVVMQSVPSNALVEGNPAIVIGYKRAGEAEQINNNIKVSDRLVAVENDDFSGEGKISLGVDDAALYFRQNFKDLRGSLIVGDFLQDFPFVPTRYFMVYDVPSEKLRGEHAHKECHQFLICIHGKCHALVDNGEKRKEILLDNPQVGLYMPPMLWGTQYKYSKDAHLLVFASHAYNPEDYIRSYESFLKCKKIL